MPMLIRILVVYILANLFYISPVQSTIMVLNDLTHENIASPGEKYPGGVELQNASREVKSVRIYQTDYWFSHTGESRYDNPGTLERSNASWVTVSELFLTLQPGEVRMVGYEVAVPSDAALRGTYWSVIMVEGIQPPDPSVNNAGMAIQTVMRYAVQIITHIGETGTSDLEFVNLGLTRKDQVPALEVDIANTGERSLRPVLSIDLIDQAGSVVATITAERKRIYPGTSARILLRLEGIKPGSYSGVIIADCDEEHVFGADVNLEI